MAKSDFDAASEGIMNPELITLPAGTALYRFGNSAHPLGAWWFGQQVMDRLRSGAQALASRDPRKGDVRSWLALNSRFLLAVKLEFSPVNILLGATLTAPVEAYTGTGKPMIDYLGADNPADATVTYPMSPKPWIKQLYLCRFSEIIPHLKIHNQEELPITLERKIAAAQ